MIRLCPSEIQRTDTQHDAIFEAENTFLQAIFFGIHSSKNSRVKTLAIFRIDFEIFGFFLGSGKKSLKG